MEADNLVADLRAEGQQPRCVGVVVCLARRYHGVRQEGQADAEGCPECNSADLVYVLNPSKHGLRFHDLRHTCASLLIAANAHPKAIQDHLGHADIQTTFNVYGHLLPQAHDVLSAALDSAYEGSSGPQAIPRIGQT